MPDIFISYRHGTTDSWAAISIANLLGEHFAVFFDANREALDLGDAFPEAIDEALHECRVVLAIIGPDWSSEANLRRLRRENDWVRRELRIALQQQTVRVVPLVIEPATVPDSGSLPEDVAPLAARQARQLSPARIATDCDDLIRRLHHWLSGRAASADQGRHVPTIIPYLCDRKDQEEAFVDMVRTVDVASNMMACVVHGHKWESHDELLERFRAEGVLEDIFGRRSDGTAIYPVQLNRSKLRAGSFAGALKSALKADVLNKRGANDDDLQQWFSTLLQPVVVVVQLTWSDYQEIGDRLVQDLIKSWQGLQQTESPASPTRALSQPALLWINLTYEVDDFELPRDVLSYPLPKLSSVEERHIREWLGLKRVTPFVAARKEELLNLPSNADYYRTPGRIHMMRFAQAVNRILSS